MSDGPVSIEMRYGVSALLATCGVALLAISAVNAKTFSPGISLLLLGILGFIANRLVYELVEKDYGEEADNIDQALGLARMIAMIAAAIAVLYLFLPLLSL